MQDIIKDDVKALEVTNLTKIYSNNVVALNDISLTVNKGDFFALLGPNGAGKSSFISILTDLVIKTRGNIKTFNIDFDKDKEAVKKIIGVVPQEVNFNIFEKVQDILINQAGYFGIPRNEAKEKSEKYLLLLGLWEKRHQLSRTLSGGMKRRLMIARGIVHEPQIIILDEPTAGLDIKIRKEIWKFLQKMNQEGRTIILTTHYLEEVEKLCRTVVVINNGRIICNTSVDEMIHLLPRQHYILDIKDKNNKSINIPNKDGIRFSTVNNGYIEVAIERHTNLNDLFKYLDEFSININSIRTKNNPIESAFEYLMIKKEVS
jgi:ABC-2 type transport system ATP-binding protein